MRLFKQVFTKDNNQNGVAMLMTVSILSLVFVSISIALARSNLINFESVELLKNSRGTFYMAETGMEDTVIQLEENISYTGNPLGEVTPIGTYFSNIDKLGDDYDIYAWAEGPTTRRHLHLDITLSYDVPAVATKAAYMADFFVIYGEGARIRGDVWTNDDFDILEAAVVEGNLVSAGKGSFAVNWVWDGIMGGNPALAGGEVKDNPDTAEFIEGNIIAADDVKVSGPNAHVRGDVISNDDVYELFGGTIHGNITENAGTVFDQIPVPIFDFEAYEAQAVIDGTYYSNANSFENYVDSLDDGNERRLPGSVYYVRSGAVKIEGSTPVYLDGLLVVEDNIYIYTEWHQTAQNGLPAIVSGKSIKIENKFNFWSWSYDYAGPVNINGIIFAERDVDIFRTFDTESITIEGAAWAGDDIFIGEHSYIHYNIDPVIIEGFGFVTGISGLTKNSWDEVI